MPVGTFIGGNATAVHIKNGIKAVANKEEHGTIEFISQLLCALLLPVMGCVWRSSKWRGRLAAISDVAVIISFVYICTGQGPRVGHFF